MLKSYLKIALRHLARHKLFSFINIFGLALSLSFCMLTIVIINDQSSFDHFHPRENDIYRVLTIAQRKDGGTEPYATSPQPLAGVLEAESPAVEKVVRLTRSLNGDVHSAGKTLTIAGFFTDPSFFEVFGFHLQAGQAATALANPNAIVLTSEFAQKFFGDGDPLGKTLTIKGFGDFLITGVLQPFPGKSHLEFDALASAASLPVLEAEQKILPVTRNWQNHYTNYTYLRLRPGHTPKELAPLLAAVPQRFYSHLKLESRDTGYAFELQPLGEITPGRMLSNNLGRAMPAIVLIFLSILAIIGMIAALFNYTTLTLARSLTRAREVGIRKVSGAARLHLFLQFIGESILIVLFALLLGEILLRTVLIPGFEQLQLAGAMALDFVIDFKVHLFFLAFAVLVGAVAGLLPAAIMSKFRPVEGLKNISALRIRSKITLRKVLIVFQFALSLVLILLVTSVYQQIRYALNVDYGFARENILTVALQGNDPQVVAREMAKLAAVRDYTAVSHNLGTWEDSKVDVRNAVDDPPVEVRDYSVDARFVDFFGLKLAAGRNFSDDLAGGNAHRVLVNERFVEYFHLGGALQALGRTLILGDSTEVQIAGVLHNFIFKPLTYSLEPMLLHYDPGRWAVLNLKMQENDIQSALATLESTWKSIDPAHPFSHRFYDDLLRQVYSQFRDFIKIVGFLAGLALTISLLGLLGMATFHAESRTREIGIRKVLGAGVHNLVVLLSKSNMLLVLLATAIALPIGLLLTNMLLQTFAYRIHPGAGVVMPAVLALLSMSAAVIGTQAYRAALVDPVRNLRQE